MIALDGIITFLSIGGLIGFFIALVFDLEWIGLVSFMMGLLSVICVIILGVIDYNITSKENVITWNEGYHADCGGKWDFYQKDNGDYIYKCDKCHKAEIFESFMN